MLCDSTNKKDSYIPSVLPKTDTTDISFLNKWDTASMAKADAYWAKYPGRIQVRFNQPTSRQHEWVLLPSNQLGDTVVHFMCW